jgi:hypothetical protein
MEGFGGLLIISSSFWLSTGQGIVIISTDNLRCLLHSRYTPRNTLCKACLPSTRPSPTSADPSASKSGSMLTQILQSACRMKDREDVIRLKITKAIRGIC